jgi:hypothetical protein
VTKCEILRRLLRLRMTRALPKQIALGFPAHRVIPSERLDQSLMLKCRLTEMGYNIFLATRLSVRRIWLLFTSCLSLAPLVTEQL